MYTYVPGHLRICTILRLRFAIKEQLRNPENAILVIITKAMEFRDCAIHVCNLDTKCVYIHVTS